MLENQPAPSATMMKNPSKATTWTRPWQWLAVDPRSVALFRICLGLVLIYDLLFRVPDLEAFFSDFGVYPRNTGGELPSNSWHFSIHSFSGSVVFIQLLLAVQLVLATGLVLGWKTRWCVFLSWILLASLQSRNFMVVNSGDVLFRCLLFWSIFIPLETRWSIDRWKGEPISSWANFTFRGHVMSAGAIAVMAQLIMMYFFTGRLKTGAAWVETYTALEQALRLDQFTREPGFGCSTIPSY